MLSIKNPKALYVRGDYNLVKHDGKIVAIIFCSREQTCRRSHQGYNDWAIFDYVYAPGYEILENKPINIALGRYCGEDVGITICKDVPTRHAYTDVQMPIRKENIVIEEYSSIMNPLAVAWGYTWHNHATKEEEYRALSLCEEEAEGLPRYYDADLAEEDPISKFIPSFYDRYKSIKEDYRSRLITLVSYNKNYLVYDKVFESYTWYDEGGKALKYTDRGEFEYLQGKRITTIYSWFSDIAERMGIEFPTPDEAASAETPADEAEEAPVERRERRQRSGRKSLDSSETLETSETSETLEE